jgi:FKBP-type peptidyl-prolyl cis-trans isomerase FkpA
MNLKSPFVATAIAAFVTLTSLSACGGSGDSSSTSAVANPAAFSATDVTVGTGAVAATGKTATVTYTGWLYSTTAANNKGTQFDTGSFSFVVGSGTVISGFDTGVTGMKVGGERTLLIPSSLGYGATGSGAIPANAGLVFDVTLTAVQ